jgi:hypothetical protein
MKLMLITNSKVVALNAFSAGVKRLFVDLEILGKVERQGHLDTLISNHSFEDISNIRKTVPNAELIVRLNPLNSNSKEEIREAIERGADIIMQPMIQHSHEVEEFASYINNRVKFIPLVETISAINTLDHITEIPGVNEIYIGLNDLHLELKKKFMFELLADGTIDRAVKVIKKKNIPFGFGGIARLSEGLLPAELILGEHVRLGSSMIILSRTFNRQNEGISDLQQNSEATIEIKKILDHYNKLNILTSGDLQKNRQELINRVLLIIESK